MSPVDSIRPPKRARKIKVTVEKPDRPPKTAEPRVPADRLSRPAINNIPQTGAANKQRTLIISVVVVMAVIFIAWAGLFASGKLTSSSGNSTFGAKLNGQLQSLWQTIKTDILRIKDTETNTNGGNVNEERIKQLEDSVFPQFKDPSKQ
ncbi:MAG: hypothetical protein WC544_03110 [Patescibacteria group bacterium]